MRVLQEYQRLNTGFRVPKLALGTFGTKGEACYNATKAALEIGYRHIVTGALYQNEADVGKALQDFQRESIFLMTKVGPKDHGYDKAKKSVENSLKKLNTDYLDCVLVHWPGSFTHKGGDEAQVELRHQTWKALEDFQREGTIKSIGTSNFLVHHLEKLLDAASAPPSINQVEHHPLCRIDDVVSFCRDRGIVLQSYSPLAKCDPVLWDSEPLNELVSKYSKTKSQILLRWSLQKNTILVFKSLKAEHLKENAQLDFELSEEDLKKLDNLPQKRLNWDPTQITV